MSWEKVDDNYSRAKTYKGWILRNIHDGHMVFLPDSMYAWRL